MAEKNLFVELLQVSVGTRDVLSRVPSAVEWQYIFDEAQRQAIAGILLEGVQRLMAHGEGCMANFPKDLMLQWIGLTLQIEQRNALTTKVCGEVLGQMEKDGLRCCVLKGQANHRYYPKEMANRRNCGDVDVWVQPVHDSRFLDEPSGKAERMVHGDVAQVLEYMDTHYERDGLCWLHCNFTHKGSVPVEVHFHPSFFSRPKYNRRFQKYFSDMEPCVERIKIDGVEIPAMKAEIDVIYQMNHIYRHLIDEGVGLRQVVDYYWLLKRLKDKVDYAKLMQTVEWLGMKRFAGALMYVLKELLGGHEKYLLCEPLEKEGKFLMGEIMISGNFGHQDPRMGQLSQGGYLKSRFSQAMRRFKRNMRFVSSYPGEVIWEPIVRVGHFAWKKLGMWKY